MWPVCPWPQPGMVLALEMSPGFAGRPEVVHLGFFLTEARLMVKARTSCGRGNIRTPAPLPQQH